MECKLFIQENVNCSVVVLYAMKNIFRRSFFLYIYNLCHYARAWICILDVPSCYEHVVGAETKSALQVSGLVRTVGPCTQGRVALLPRAIELAREAYTLLNNNYWCEAAPCISRGLLSKR